MHAPLSSGTDAMVPLETFSFPLHNRLINEKKMYESYHKLIDTRNDLIDIRAIAFELKTKIAQQELDNKTKKEYKLTLEKREAAFLPSVQHVLPWELNPTRLSENGITAASVHQNYIDKWNLELTQAKLNPINPHVWNLPSIVWLLVCIIVHGYGLYVAETSRIELETSSANRDHAVVALCRNAIDWIIVLSYFLIGTASINIFWYYVVHPLLLAHLDLFSYRFYKLRQQNHEDCQLHVCLPLHVLALLPWFIYGFVLFFNPLAETCQPEVYYYGLIYSIFPGTVVVLLSCMALCFAVYACVTEPGEKQGTARVLVLVAGLVLLGFVVLYFWFFVFVVEVGEKHLTQNTLVLNNQTGTTASIELAQTCAGGAQYLIIAGRTILIYSGILVFFGVLLLFLTDSNYTHFSKAQGQKYATDCTSLLFLGRFVIELVFGILGGVLFFNSDRYACGAELFGFGLGLSIVFIFSSLSTCTGLCSARQPKKN